MSTENWWRCPRSSGQLESMGESTWPALSPRRRPPRRKTRRSCCDDTSEGIRDQARSADRSNFLDNEGYPQLGQGLSKRKLPGCSQTPGPGGSGELDVGKLTLDNAETTDERSVRKFSKKPRREQLICIDLKQVLERQRSLSESQTASSPKPRIKLNLNLTIRNPLDSSNVVQCWKGVQRKAPRAKRISKLEKRVIIREREFKRERNVWRRELFDIEKMRSITKDVSEIDFNRLKISGEAKPEVTVVRNMSAMSLFDNKYRKPTSDDVPDDLVPETKTDVVSRLQNLLLERDEEPEPAKPEVYPDDENEFMDSNIVSKTLCLKICDETGETVEEEPAAPEIPQLKSVGIEPEGVSVSPASLRHSRNFREYCTNALTPELNRTTETFLAELYRLQRRMYERNEVKGRFRRRFYTGFKEVLKHIESKKIKFVLIAPDVEGIRDYEGGLDELVSKLITACKMKEVVFCFALKKRKLGYFTHKKGSVSCVGVTNYGGLEENFEDVLRELISARNSYALSASPGESGAQRSDPSCNQDWDEMLLSTRINLLLKTLTVT